ncbi:MAG: oligosaccharide flippase family protein [Desulfobacteraceae bacterium]|nr:oligosaccharide flippase family protein [Desulfobacteraceae bacterium]
MVLHKIKNKCAEILSRHKTLLSNFSTLSFIQIFNFGLPLITYPYLIRVLGRETYGLIIYAQSIVALCMIIINYGFNISATKNVAIHRADRDKLSEIFSSITYIKCVLFILCGFFLAAIVSFSPMLMEYRLLMMITFFTCIHEILFPRWFFLGTEKMHFLAFIEIISKLIFSALIFIFIHSPDDYLWMPGLVTIGHIVGGSVTFYAIFKKEQLKLLIMPLERLFYYLKDSFPFFLSQSLGEITERSASLFLGTFIGMTEVAYYDLANKVIRILHIPFMVINSAVYPQMARTKNIPLLKKIIGMSFLLGVFMYICLTVFSKFIILFLAGKELMAAQPYFYLLGLILPIYPISDLMGTNGLVVMGYTTKYNLSGIYGSLFFLLLLLILYFTKYITAYSVIYSMIAYEVLILLYTYYYCRKYCILKC